MFVYRLASRVYAADDSEGAKLYGGRWNRAGTPVVYASSTRSLAALEIIVHNGAIPVDYRIVVIELPDTLAIASIELKNLPIGWPSEDSISETASYGTEWASSMRTAALSVPSAVIPAERNYILNPLHPDFKTIHFDVAQTEYIDKRLRKRL